MEHCYLFIWSLRLHLYITHAITEKMESMSCPKYSHLKRQPFIWSLPRMVTLSWNKRIETFSKTTRAILILFYLLKLSRVQKELKQLQSLKPHGIRVTLPSDSLQIWQAVVPGPNESLYKGTYNKRLRFQNIFSKLWLSLLNTSLCSLTKQSFLFGFSGGQFKVQVYLPYPSDLSM